MNGLLRRILRLWVRVEVRPEKPAEQLAARSVPVCYVLERRSRVDLAMLQNIAPEHNLPRPARRLFSGAAMVASQSGVVRDLRGFFYLFQQRGFWDQRIDRRPPAALRALIDAALADPHFDIDLVPVAVYWGRAPQKEASWLRLLLVEDWAVTGSLRKVLTVLFNGRATMVELGEPMSLRALLATPPAHAAAAADAQTASSAGLRLARQLRAQFRRQRAARIGPDLSHRRTIVAGVVATRAVRVAAAQEMRSKKISRRAALLVARKYGDEIAANYSHSFVRFAENLLTRIWNRLYNGVEFNHADTLRAVAEGQEIVYVPCHRSHMDYLLLSYAIYHHGYAVPHIAAGVNLNIPVVGRYLRKAGAFFIRRSFRGNTLYTVVFMKYLAAIMARGHSIEYFIEGGRSRTGRLLAPKTGMISMTVRSFLRDPKRPVVFVPVYFGYERIVEANTYIGELSGQPKKKESVLDLVRALRVLRENFGRVYVNIGEPIALNAKLDMHAPDWRAVPFDDDTRAGWISRTVDDVAQHVMCNINAAAAVTPINLLAIALLATPRLAMPEADLLRQVQFYLDLLRGMPYSERVTVTPMTAVQIVGYGIDLQVITRQAHKLGDLIHMSDRSAVLATYYRNNVLHLFAMPSLLACAFNSNAVVRTEDLHRLVWRIYPYISSELFLRWREDELPQLVTTVLQQFAAQGLLESVDGNNAWRRPPPTAPQAVQLSLLAQTTIQTIERYYLAIAVLIKAGTNQLTPKALAERCQLMAQRITMLYGINSPEFFDRALFDQFISLLLQRGVMRTGASGQLEFDDVLLRVATDAEFVLSEQLRHSILQVAHV